MFSFSALFARLSVLTGLLLLSCTVKAAPAAADTTGLLFYLSGETGFRADYAAGNPKPMVPRPPEGTICFFRFRWMNWVAHI